MATKEQMLKDFPIDPYVQNNLAYYLATAPDKSLRDLKRALELAKQSVAATKENEPGILDKLKRVCGC